MCNLPIVSDEYGTDLFGTCRKPGPRRFWVFGFLVLGFSFVAQVPEFVVTTRNSKPETKTQNEKLKTKNEKLKTDNRQDQASLM
jgi:hypothetical protein